ncbi:fasciclin domain-containing protein [Spirosoma sp. HMF3257]|uniref:Fasciclin domain-containing protein n=1 Tax=Spirosoma telluris TaxID=2183553 RepID=A0A327NEA7_9BACT|nr:fasciclin domain-containing protein [Spirosoma telluris]MVM42127.1 fasciclin domain-containing protein [Spirosoma telluris]RAI73043.1 fasciclin domain-containing protein [Spirosoma telluris]RAI73173.1 fasciclin domain-containing protein [Spirosoma telluris]
MKTYILTVLFAGTLLACDSTSSQQEASSGTASTEQTPAGQSAVEDNDSQKDVVKVAIGSPDHTTLVKAVQAADLVNVLSNAGPFTVFAPTNAAFAALPAGTVDELLKPENKEKLADILQYHVSVAGYPLENLHDGQIINQVNGGNATITVKDGNYKINDANIIATVKASNGIVHVIDKVILPPTK